MKQKEVERGCPDRAASWDDFLKIDETRREWQIALRRAWEADSWTDWSLDEKMAYSRTLLSPFSADDGMLAAFVEQVERQ